MGVVDDLVSPAEWWAYSAKCKVTNGVRQGGILSPYLFNVYVDELSEELNKCNVGCNLNGLLINHIMYADDLVLISPSSARLSQVLRECEKFGTRHDVKYNAKKSAVMIYRSMTLKGCTIPNFNLNGMILHVVASYKYLGHYITLQMIFLMMMISIDNVELYLFKGILYTAKVGCETHTLSYLLFAYVYSTTLVELQKI